MLEKYETYPLILSKDELKYTSKDNAVIKITYNNNNINIEKYKKIYQDNSFKEEQIFNGKYTWLILEKLYLGGN